MTVTAYSTLTERTTAELDAAVTTAIAAGSQPLGDQYWDEGAGQYCQPMATIPATAGAVPTAVAAYVTVTETGDVVKQTVLTLTALPIGLTAVTLQGGGVKIFTFPKGRICRIGAEASLAITTTSVLADTLNTGATGNYGVGSTVQANPTVATTEQDFVNVAAWTASATINVPPASAPAVGVGPGVLASLDGRATAIAAFLNLGIASAGSIDADATVIVSGTIRITWSNIGV